ncbi:MarR family winged helix-turn-helix transcriptional regulator [Burkholderia sp. L27(2015)]|uniref:MarR family winged helix-turn-helix transcriptional regulator n=1 Tax=Burkholderia sp. L27(2015) TaxID=1641858 RepID=UPI00131C29AD|nr:MarR family transcriptional regulator [Burkholderia sp. L27(2015)]
MEHYTRETFLSKESIGLSLNKARNMLLAKMDAALKEEGVTSQQMGIVLTMSRGAASTPFELSKLLGIDTGLMTRMLDKLEKQGLLARVRSVEDRRVVNLHLTETGVALGTRIPDIALNVLNPLFRNFSGQEFEELHRLLNKMVEA